MMLSVTDRPRGVTRGVMPTAWIRPHIVVLCTMVMSKIFYMAQSLWMNTHLWANWLVADALFIEESLHSPDSLWPIHTLASIVCPRMQVPL